MARGIWVFDTDNVGGDGKPQYPAAPKAENLKAMPWVDPHSGGMPVPKALQRDVVARVEKHAAARYAGLYTRLDIRFRGVLGYIDAYVEPQEPDPQLLELTKETRDAYMERMRQAPIHLCRIRYFGNPEQWSLAYYSYSGMKYEPSVFDNFTFYGTPEEAFDACAMYLTDK